MYFQISHALYYLLLLIRVNIFPELLIIEQLYEKGIHKTNL